MKFFDSKETMQLIINETDFFYLRIDKVYYCINNQEVLG